MVRQVIQVGEGLAEGEAYLVPVEGSPEQDPHQFDGGLWDLARGNHLVAARPVMRSKAVDSRVQSEKRQVVRRQYQGLGGTASRNLARDAR